MGKEHVASDRSHYYICSPKSRWKLNTSVRMCTSRNSRLLNLKLRHQISHQFSLYPIRESYIHLLYVFDMINGNLCCSVHWRMSSFHKFQLSSGVGLLLGNSGDHVSFAYILLYLHLYPELQRPSQNAHFAHCKLPAVIRFINKHSSNKW